MMAVHWLLPEEASSAPMVAGPAWMDQFSAGVLAEAAEERPADLMRCRVVLALRATAEA